MTYPTGIFLLQRHICVYDGGTISLTPCSLARTFLDPAKSLHKSEQIDEVSDAHECTAVPYDDFRIRGCQIRPLDRHRADGRVVDAQQEPLAVAVVALAYTDKLPSAAWMERMHNPHKLRRFRRNVCIPS